MSLDKPTTEKNQDTKMENQSLFVKPTPAQCQHLAELTAALKNFEAVYEASPYPDLQKVRELNYQIHDFAVSLSRISEGSLDKLACASISKTLDYMIEYQEENRLRESLRTPWLVYEEEQRELHERRARHNRQNETSNERQVRLEQERHADLESKTDIQQWFDAYYVEERIETRKGMRDRARGRLIELAENQQRNELQSIIEASLKGIEAWKKEDEWFKCHLLSDLAGIEARIQTRNVSTAANEEETTGIIIGEDVQATEDSHQAASDGLGTLEPEDRTCIMSSRSTTPPSQETLDAMLARLDSTFDALSTPPLEIPGDESARDEKDDEIGSPHLRISPGKSASADFTSRGRELLTADEELAFGAELCRRLEIFLEGGDNFGVSPKEKENVPTDMPHTETSSDDNDLVWACLSSNPR